MLNYFTFSFRSMLGQMLSLTLIFLVVVLVAIVVIPILKMQKDIDPIKQTVQYSLDDIRTFVFAPKGQETAQNIKDSERIKIVRAYNPDFQYYVKVNDDVYSSTETSEALWAKMFDLPNVTQMERKLADIEDCANVSLRMYKKTAKGLGYVFSSLCGSKEIYYEVSGIANPVPQFQGWLTSDLQSWLWRNSKTYVYLTLGVMVIAFLVVFITTKSIRRVAKVAQSFDPDSIDHTLPESGLPNEVLPLIQAINQMINKIDDSKEQQNFFLSTAAHEMRTPLAILRTRIEELSSGEVKEQLKQDIYRLTKLVNDLLKLMRIKTPEQFSKHIEIVEIIKTVIAERAPNALMNEVELSFYSEINSFEILGDKGLFEVAIANLIDNAVSFSPKGAEVSISIDSKGTITVIDQGQGISPKVMPRLFEPFAKAPPNRDGHGLGLAIVKAIINLHRGEINAYNFPSSGAKFSITFKE
ncbi:sensor histidine kinase [Parashewanella curva]|uniref:histidine kinase n=1 Tax=Parashewanella curva TaxID=2338552 RepID=A0A3L8PWX4_9GAMM|nr:HAMP domain-containing sensor histidine kinase [Parashewanella curva]RLV59876.1 sensor histidine kinase [Parashewanella curva]